ncbi:GNAT family N-acetyltransferase [Lactococcus allomyrinae]|uniref:N-acetyltransferase n=1 Tax=Lactococcus allomyrinae TaxID=2419773 RepID=A0A387BNH2_9LACT|nr:GNAT family N-acetyltransferase [Lactococcus allomyrinae]AYG00071.1 N-acetyltransferase [Lactococcus allomyrinae]
MNDSKIILAEHETFETNRLILRKISLADAEDMFEFTSDPEVARYVTYPPHENLDITKDGIVNYFIPNRLENWGIVDKATNKVIGTIALWIKGDSGTFGWALNRNYWGKGLMPEAASVLRDFAFNTLKLNVIIADHYAVNQKSGRVMEKVGMHKIGRIWIYMKKEEKSVLADYWALTRAEYLDEVKDGNYKISEG